MAFGMIPIDVSQIDEGQFMEALSERLQEAQRAIAEHVHEFGDLAHKAVCKIDSSISIVCMNPAEGTFAIKWEANVKRPKRPASITTAIQAEGEDGKPALYVKAGGSDSGNPRQQKFARRDGSMVEPIGHDE